MRGESIYSLKLTRRGIRLRHGRDTDLMESILVQHVINKKPITVASSFQAQSLADLFLQTNLHAFPILNEKKQLCGAVSLSDLRRVKDQDNLSSLTVLDIGTLSPLVVYPDENLQVALRRMAHRDLSCLPVVSRQDEAKLEGMVYRSDIISAYQKALVERKISTTRQVAPPPGTQLLTFEITSAMHVLDQTLADIPFPKDCTVISIQRKGSTLIPHGDTSLSTGDSVTMLCSNDEVGHLEEIIGASITAE